MRWLRDRDAFLRRFIMAEVILAPPKGKRLRPPPPPPEPPRSAPDE